jgi:putative heme iron utilization protein
LVLVAQDRAGLPLLLLSDLAEHTKNIGRDGRASLLFDGTAEMAEPLAGPRLTVMGRIEPIPDPAALARYVAHHPSAQAWAAMADFRLYRLIPTRAHLVAGFGRIAWIDAAALFSPAN